MEDDLANIIASEALRFGMTADDIRSRHMATPYVKARRRIARIARDEGFSYPEIGTALARHHSTVISLLNGRRP